MSVGLGLVAVVIIVGGLAWVTFWPSERDRFTHTFWGWVALFLLLGGFAAAKLLQVY